MSTPEPIRNADTAAKVLLELAATTRNGVAGRDGLSR